MVSLSFFFSLSVCTLSHTLSVCFSLSPSLSMYLHISISHSLSPSFSLSLCVSSVLHCCPSTIQLIFYNLFILFCWLYFILPSIILFILFISMPMNQLLLLLHIRIRSPQLLSMLPNIMWKIGEMRGKIDEWVG